LHTVLVGELTCAREDFPAARVRQGDLVLVRGGRYRFVHEPGAAARPVAEVLAAGPAPGTPRTYVLGDGHGTELLCGAYAFDGGLWSAMVATLPAVTVVTSAGNRALSAHWTAPQAAAPDWFRALSDPVAGPALGALHEAPARSWTVGDLAVRAGVSRAMLARRFAAATGMPPLAYLTRWRMELAKDELERPGTTIGARRRQPPFSRSAGLRSSVHVEYGLAADAAVQQGVDRGPRLAP
jgi:AraC-like DNA-binding protein